MSYIEALEEKHFHTVHSTIGRYYWGARLRMAVRQLLLYMRHEREKASMM